MEVWKVATALIRIEWVDTDVALGMEAKTWSLR